MRDSKYSHLLEPSGDRDKIALDFETTSLDTKKAEILTIGAVRIRGNTITYSERLELTIEAPKSLNASSIEIHQLRAQDLADGIPIQEALLELLAFIGSRTIIGYNIRYDLRILNRYTQDLFGYAFLNPVLDVGQLYAHKLHVPYVGMVVNQDLQNICNKLQIPLKGRHSAMDDALTAALIYLRLEFGPRPSS
ncbi:3'-5' exonuclease [Alginatibacterium sediminis]|uniref:3'-5' exonuclease n=2 Tax=Alginatibacterium sediminis TaxID=2164068 RepID=A0A420E8G3_9ALTE|nr:3'-5' exonuclease [Alginatibacterium sediminis]